MKNILVPLIILMMITVGCGNDDDSIGENYRVAIPIEPGQTKSGKIRIVEETCNGNTCYAEYPDYYVLTTDDERNYIISLTDFSINLGWSISKIILNKQELVLVHTQDVNSGIDDEVYTLYLQGNSYYFIAPFLSDFYMSEATFSFLISVD